MFCIKSLWAVSPQRASQEIPDKRILQEEKAEWSMRQLSVWLGWAFDEPNRQKILQYVAAGR